MNDAESILNRIDSPRDLKGLSDRQLEDLAAEIRRLIVEVVSSNGGHLASNLGVVELTLALHLEFDSPRDMIVWDVGHQCYVHKLLTGRRRMFRGIRRSGGLSGFPKQGESEHDLIETGHASTSISSALGLVVGRRMRGETGKVIAVIGDGALTGGLALEGLNHAGHLGRDLIVVLNDNKMSIGHPVGALSFYLSQLTMSELYQKLRRHFDRAVKTIPRYGTRLMDMVVRVKRAVKGLVFKETLFSDFGFDYVGPVDGHNLGQLRQVLRSVAMLDGPVVVHVVTKKGKGYAHAEDDPATFHGVSGFSIIDGTLERRTRLTFTDVFGDEVLKAADEDERLVAITAAMAKGTGLAAFAERHPQRFFDVGITEPHAITFASGLAATGCMPVVAIYSTFMQRAVDQFIHDAALPGRHILVGMDRAGFVADDGETHQGLFDIALFRSVPNLTFMAPSTANECRMMVRYGLALQGPVLIRYPKADCPAVDSTEPLSPGRGVFFVHSRASVLLVVVGALLEQALDTRRLLHELDMDCDIYLMRFIKPIDRPHFLRIVGEYEVVIFLEEGSVQGGLGEYLGGLVREAGLGTNFTALGAQDRFFPHATRKELLVSSGLDAASIAARVRELGRHGLFQRISVR